MTWLMSTLPIGVSNVRPPSGLALLLGAICFMSNVDAIGPFVSMSTRSPPASRMPWLATRTAHRGSANQVSRTSETISAGVALGYSRSTFSTNSTKSSIVSTCVF